MDIKRRTVALVGIVVAAALAVAGVGTYAMAADPALSGSDFSPTATWAWTNGASLGNTTTGAQYAEADVSGLSDADHNAGFRVRLGAGNVLVAVSGTAWKIEPSAGGDVSGMFAHSASGHLKVTIDISGVVSILWNGTAVATRTVSGSYPGLGIAPSVWQSSAIVKMTGISGGTLETATPTTATTTTTTTSTSTSDGTVTITPTVTAPAVTITPTVTAPAVTITPTVTAPAVTITPTVTGSPSPTTDPTTMTTTTTTSEPTAAPEWLSGAASVYAANGTFGTWRGEPVKIVGTWSDSKDCSATVCSFEQTGDMAGVQGQNIYLDIAVGAIWSGQSWSSAAAGSYNTAWTGTLNALKSKLAAKNMDPGKVFIRFAHEMNGDWTEWRVPSGQEANFRAAISRFSALRYQVFGTTDAPKVVLCANDGSSSGMADPHSLFVGLDSSSRQVVDVYCIDTYNQYPHRTDAAAIRAAMNDTGNSDSIESHRAFAESVGVPFSVGEWGNCGIAAQCSGGGGESPEYVREMNNYFRAHAGDIDNPGAGQVLYEVQFNLWTRFALYGAEASQPLTSNAYASAVWGS